VRRKNTIKRVSIVGAGAMGCLFAYFFTRSGIDTGLFETNPDVVEKIRHGLTVAIDGERVPIRVEVSDQPGSVGAADAVFLFVKSYATRPAMEMVSPFLPPGSTVVSLQNGIGNREAIAGFVPPEQIVYGATTIGATKTGLNEVSYGGSGDIIIGGDDEAAVAGVSGLLEKSGLPVSVSPDPETAVWRKAVINAGINPLGALLGIPNGKILENPYSLALQEAILREAVAVAHGLSVSIDFTEIAISTRKVCAATSANRCSMLQDIEAGRKTEIDSINGYINRQGKALSIYTPVNETLCRLIKSREPV